jgi:hypothetical protein
MTAFDPRDEQDEQRCDMTPMIDLIFLLLIFFILSARFVAPEQAIQALLPRDGSGPVQSMLAEPPIQVRILPDAVSAGAGPHQLQAAWDAGHLSRQQAELRIGGSSLSLDGRQLDQPQGSEAILMAIHGAVAAALGAHERPGQPRGRQTPVEIHCFSDLPWKYALAAYDAARAYERSVGGTTGAGALAERQLSFSAPHLRNHDPLAAGEELWRLRHGR